LPTGAQQHEALHMASASVDGTCDEAFARVRDVFEASFDKGEVGAGVAVYVDGEKVVDLWGGWADGSRTKTWQRDTIVNTFSTTKGMTATCAHRLIERGLVDVDEPVATYWPEFAQAGKGRVTVRHLLTHQAGLHALATELPRDKRHDWAAVTEALAAQAPAWEPGTKSMYHAVTFGYLVGEVVRRVDGRSLGTYFKEEIAEPLGADYLIGFGPEHDARCAEVLPPNAGGEGDGAASPMGAAYTGMGRGANTREWRAAEIPAANGHGTADGVARLYAALSRGGELAGVQVLKPDTIDTAIVRQHPAGPGDGAASAPSVPGQVGAGRIAGLTGLPFGLGYMRIGDLLRMRTGADAPGAALFGHPGAGGSTGLADPDAKVGFGYVMNQMQAGMVGGAHGFNLIFAVYDCLKAA
jgi:CubicO group peptidase (beta-lactamase class C family)